MNIIINGGTRGIGRELVSCLAKDVNNRIIATGRNEAMLQKLSGEYKNVKTVSIDMSVFDSQAGKFNKVVSGYFESVDILINLAGTLIAKDFIEITNDEARLIMETNFFGPATMIRIIQPI